MKKLFMAALIATAVSGCGSTSKGKQEFDTANQLAAASQYEEAIAYLSQAVAQNPNSEEYRKALAAMKAKFESESVGSINQLLSNNPNNQDILEAEGVLAKLSSALDDNALVASLAQKIQSAKDTLYAELEQKYQTASNAYAAGDLVASFKMFKEIEARFANYEDVSLKLQSISREVNKTYLKDANAALKADDFGTAIALLKDMLEINPNNGIAKNLLNKANASNNPNYFLKKAKEKAAIEDWDSALSLCSKALSMQRNNSECLLLTKQAKEELNKQSQQGFLDAMSESRLMVAKNLLQTVIDHGSNDPALLGQYKNSFSQRADYSASLYIDQGNYAMAWMLLKAIEEVNPIYPELFNKIREVEDNLTDRAKRSIAVFDFNSPADNDDAGLIVSNNLRARLFNNASRDITILERENLNSILEEMKLGQIGVVSESTAKEMGRVYGIDYAIMGSVLLYKVDENSSKSTKTIRYQTGEKIEDNIDYLNWKAINPKPTRKELQEAPQAKIKVPEFGQTEYEFTQTKKVGFIQLSFRIVDVLTGENTGLDTIEKKIEVEDTANAGVEEAGVKFDPMDIATDTEILQQITEEVVESMASDVLKPLQQLETYYFNEGLDREKRSEVAEAIEYYTYALFNEKVKSVSSSPITLEAQKRIDSLISNYRFAE